MTFVYPSVLLLLLAVPVLLGLKQLADSRGKRTLSMLVASRLQPRLVTGSSTAAGWTVCLLQVMAIVCFILALARPQWGFAEEEASGEGRDIFIGIDTSRSMLAEDISPNRFERARIAALDLIRSAPDDRFGLIAFAGRAFVQAPLTIDHEAVIETIGQLDTSIIPRGGSNLAEAIERARESFAEAEEGESRALVLFTDGENLEGEAADAAARAAEEGMTIVTVGVGSAQGAIIPDPERPGAFVRDASGSVVRTRMDRETLEQLARITSGTYLTLEDQRVTRSQLADALAHLDRSQISLRRGKKPIERFQWPLAGGFIFGALAFAAPLLFPAPLPVRAGSSARRSAPAASIAAAIAAAAILLGATPSSAISISRTDEPRDEAHRAFRDGDFETAIARYREKLETPLPPEQRRRLEFGLGAAAFRAEDFETAIDAFSGALLSSDPDLQADAHYNLGNSLFRRGQAALSAAEGAEALDPVIADWNDAIDHYDSTLAISPDHADAKFNRDAVEQWLKLLEQQQRQQQEGEPQQGEGGEGGEGESQRGEGESKGGSSEGEGNGQSNNREEGSGQDGQQQDRGEGDRERDQNQSGEAGEEQEPQDLSGKLEAKKGAGEEGDGDRKPSRGDESVNPETGFSKSRARQILRAFADEDLNVRPDTMVPYNENYKDW